jgi:hypothetical protein
MKRMNSQTFALSSLAIVVLGMMLSTAQAQRGPRGMANSQSDAQLEKAPVPKDDNEAKILGILGSIRATQSYRNVPPQDGRLLRLLAETMNAKNIIESHHNQS